MEPRAHHVLIGLFTVIVCGAALLFALWLGKSYKDADLAHYTVVFNEAVRGLSQGSAVQYNGIKIGDVADLSLDPEDPRKVLARIRVEGDIPVTVDTAARLVLTGITGTSVIELSGGTPGATALTAPEGEDPVIIATPSPITQLLANSDNLMTNVTELVVSAKSVMSPANAQRLGNTLASLEAMAGAMADQKDDLTALLQALTAAGKQATITLQQASTLMRNADALVTKQGRETLEGAGRAMVSLDKASATINAIVQKNRGALSGGMQGLNQLGPTLQELRRTLASMRQVTRGLEGNAANYLLGRDKLQEFEP